jgi:cephalosporin hydroxylase
MSDLSDQIQGWFNFREPYRQAVREASDGAVFAELGCWKGKSSVFLGSEILKSGKKIKVHFVDHWGGSDEPEHKADPDLERVFEVFQGNIALLRGLNCSVHRRSTVDSAKDFADDSLDFIWVDAGHEEHEVLADIKAWWPKLKTGGVMGGDDYPMNGVKSAVTQVFPQHEVGSESGWQWWRVRKRG